MIPITPYPHQHFTHSNDLEQWMAYSLRIAGINLGNTGPNPAVGAVIICDGKVISYGYTAKGGRPHAETIAIEEAKRLGFTDFANSTMFVSLEPCAHYGKTPPCAQAIIDSGIKNVVVACCDPDPRVSGKGIEMLQKQGINVTTGILEQEAKKLNKGFFKRITQKKPYITIKCGITLDGNIATYTGDSKWITCEQSRKYAHYLRYRNDAILVGKNTFAKDNPQLNCRLPGLEECSPLRVVLDSNLSLKYTDNTENLLVASIIESDLPYVKTLPSQDSQIDINALLFSLAQEYHINYLLVEGGSGVINSFIKQRLFDEIIIIQSPQIIGSDAIGYSGPLNLKTIDQSLKLIPKKRFNLGNDTVGIYSIA